MVPSSISWDTNMLSEFTTDTLTGLGNIFSFLVQVQDQLTQARSRQGFLSLVLICVSNYEDISVSHGSGGADYVMQTIATVISSVVEEYQGKSDVERSVFRFGNSEFAVLVPDLTCGEVERLFAAVRAKVEQISWPLFDEKEVKVNLAASAVCYPFCASSLGDLIAYAQLFLQKSLQGGGGINCPRNQENQNALELSVELHQSSVMLVETLANKIIETLAVVQQTRQLAYTDPISGLPNQRAARKFLQDAFTPNRPLTVALIDGDDLRRYNDHFDYEVGNTMIRRLGRLIRKQGSGCWFAARWLTGDEFLLVCPNMTKAQVYPRLEKLRRHVDETSRNWPLPITISIGVASYPEDATTLEQLLSRVELANKRAKQAGKNIVMLFEPGAH